MSLICEVNIAPKILNRLVLVILAVLDSLLPVCRRNLLDFCGSVSATVICTLFEIPLKCTL